MTFEKSIEAASAGTWGSFFENFFNEVLFFSILLVAWACGKYQSQKAKQPLKSKVDIAAAAQAPTTSGNQRKTAQSSSAPRPASGTRAPCTSPQAWAQRVAATLPHGDAKAIARKIGHELQEASVDVIAARLTCLLDLSDDAGADLHATIWAVARERDVLEQLRGIGKKGNGMTSKSERESHPAQQGYQALKAAFRLQDFDNVLRQFVSLHNPSHHDGVSDGIPQGLREGVIQMASQLGKFEVFMEAMRSSRMSARTLNAMLKDCAQREHSADLEACRQYGYDMKIAFNCATYSILIENADSSEMACTLFEEAASSGVRMGRLCEVAAERAENSFDSALAHIVLGHLPSSPASATTVAALLHQRADAARREDKAVDTEVLELYETRFLNVDLSSYPRAQQIVFDCASRAGRSDIVAKLVGPEGGAAAAVRSSQNASEAMRIFEACPSKTAQLYQVLLDALSAHGDERGLEKLLEDAAVAGVAEANLYLGVVLLQVRCGAIEKARASLSAMQAAGLQPTVKVFNALLEASLKKGSKDCMATVREMEAWGVKPDSNTCRLLLEHSQRRPDLIQQAAAMAEGVENLSEIFGLLLETCLRNDGVKLLKPFLKLQRGPEAVVVRDAITYSHLIRAYGVAEDIDGAWAAWKEMNARNIAPLRVTLGCMVQALVSNKQPAAGYALVREMRNSMATCDLVNAIVYNSLIKGFGYAKSFDQAWAVYDEMKDWKMELTTMTFNTLIDACARSNEMTRLPSIFEDMKARGVELDQVSYNTVIKGLCHEKRLDEALELRKKMREGGQHIVDAHAYGALLDGCSRKGKYQLGFELLQAMQEEGVVPNNVTLTSLVRLAGFSHQTWALDRAFSLCDELCRKHGLRLNWHVYKNLSKACVAHGDYKRALGVVAQAARSAQQVDETVYGPIIRGLAEKRQTLPDAACVLRVSAGLPGSFKYAPNVAAILEGVPAQALRAQGGLSAQFVSDMLTAIAAIDQELAVVLGVELERQGGFHLDRQTKLRLAWGGA